VGFSPHPERINQMTIFQHIYWGYEITCPDFWHHQKIQDTDYFVSNVKAVESNYDGSGAGQIQIRGEWNWSRQNVEPLWNTQLGKLASIFGAKNVSSAPWRLGEAFGLEAEIVLPKKDNLRLWTGILMHDFLILHFLVTHPKEEREKFEPEATKIISSLGFPKTIAGVQFSSEGLPLPPDFTAIDPQHILKDISDPDRWRAFSGVSDVGALQSFYLRELTLHKWKIVEYVPFTSLSELGFARYKLEKDKQQITLGLMPAEEVESGNKSTQSNIVYKITSL
jgi:hypothetical protein